MFITEEWIYKLVTPYMECDTIKMNNVMVRSITHTTLKNVLSRRNQMLVGLQGQAVMAID